MHAIAFYQSEFVSYLEHRNALKEPKNLYEPISYIMAMGGKRLRPVLTLMATEIFGGDYRTAMDAALAVEVFHNFSLVHDDIMDAAPLRRGKPTVHEKWNVTTGILSGDAMLIMAYQLFQHYNNDTFKELVTLFSKTALQVCEGQQYDMDFESMEDVPLNDYLKMIRFKTAVLVGTALKMGAIVAGASAFSKERIYDFGVNLGIAFQIQDDYLDAFGNPNDFGKQEGGDIIANKKTYLYIKALELGTAVQKKELKDLFSLQPERPEDKILQVKRIYEESGAAKATRSGIVEYTEKAFEALGEIDISPSKKDILKSFGDRLMRRNV